MKLKIIVCSLFIAAILSIAGTASATQKKLPPCLQSPNCISSQSMIIDKLHFIPPFEIKSNPRKAWAELKKLIHEQSRMVITHETSDSLHAEATSLLFRFVDDINIVLDADAELIHIRSASRTGHSDFGVNLKRIEALRTKLKQADVIE